MVCATCKGPGRDGRPGAPQERTGMCSRCSGGFSGGPLFPAWSARREGMPWVWLSTQPRCKAGHSRHQQDLLGQAPGEDLFVTARLRHRPVWPLPLPETASGHSPCLEPPLCSVSVHSCSTVYTVSGLQQEGDCYLTTL